MTEKFQRRYSVPTDAVTKRQLDKVDDRLGRRLDSDDAKRQRLTVRLRACEAEISELKVIVREIIALRLPPPPAAPPKK